MRLLLVLNYFACTTGQDIKIGTVNSPPSATILSPADGEAFDESSTVTFEAMIGDS